jgi:Flp pilus assembly protein TadG
MISRESSRRPRERGTALLEAAITMPIVLLVAVGIFEFGRAYQTWQVVTNAAREGARVAVLPNSSTDAVVATVRAYLERGALPGAGRAAVTVARDVAVGPYSASLVTVEYPFEFIVFQPVVRLVRPGSRTGEPLVVRAAAVMRNEAQ